jgi:ribonuclease E/ribonuclease G
VTVELLIDRRGPLLRAATVVDGVLTDLQMESAELPSLLGAVFLGRVDRIVPGLDAAFVDLGGEGRAGLLALSDIRVPGAATRKDARAGNKPIGRLLRGGQPVLVQVKAEPGGTKGPTLTMDVALAGRFLVATPLAPGITVSRRLGRAEERQRLVALVEGVTAGGGWIVRAGAADADPALLEAEAEWLALSWRAVEAAAAGAAPALLKAPPDAALRAVVEQGARGLDAVVVEDEAAFAGLAAWAAEAAPDLAGRITRHRGPAPLFERHDLDGAIADLAERVVPLPGGGSIVIDRTEALIAVDVNGGERGNALAVNLEAAREIARQLRLRNLGGIVVVDFIGMRAERDRERLVAELTHAVADDPSAVQVHGLTRLGLVEMVRPRRGPPVPDLLLAAGRQRPNL